MNIISGLYNEGQIRVGIVATRFNEVVVSKLVDGAADGLSRHGVDMDRRRCPGSGALYPEPFRK